MSELLQAQDEHRLHRVIASARRLHLMLLDELGFVPFSPTGAQTLFTFCSELYERVAMIVTTNLKFADWVQIFGDERLTAALLDRLTHHAHILELGGGGSPTASDSGYKRPRLEMRVGGHKVLTFQVGAFSMRERTRF